MAVASGDRDAPQRRISKARRRLWIIVFVVGAVAAATILSIILMAFPPVEGDPRADAVAALEAEIGAAAAKSGVAYIPLQGAGTWDQVVRVGPYFLAVDGKYSYIVVYSCPSSQTPRAKRHPIARLHEARARAMAAAIRYIMSADGESFRTAGNINPQEDYYFQVSFQDGHTTSACYGEMLDAIRVRAARRYMDKAAKGLGFIERGEEISRLAVESLNRSIYRPGEFRQELIYRALAYIEDNPQTTSLDALKKIDELKAGKSFPGTMSKVPLIGRLWRPSLPAQELPDVSAALWRVKNLAGKTREEQADILSRALFTSLAANDKAAADMALAAFLSPEPKACCEAVAERWNTLSTYERDCIVKAALPQDDVEPFAKLALGDPALRHEATSILARQCGGHEYAKAYVAQLPTLASLDATAANPEQLEELEHRYAEAYEVFREHDETTEIPTFFANELLAIPAGDGRWRMLSGPSRVDEADERFEVVSLSPLEHMCKTLARAGGRQSVDVLMHAITCCGDGPFVGPNGKPMAEAYNWHPFAGKELFIELAQSSDAYFDDAMYDYLVKRAPDHLDNHVSSVFIEALGMKGDARLIALLEPVAAKLDKELAARTEADDRDPRKFQLSIAAQNLRSLCEGAVLCARLRGAPSPVELLAATYKFHDAILEACAIRTLAQKYSAAELEALLADKRWKKLRAIIYFALVKRREMDAQ